MTQISPEAPQKVYVGVGKFVHEHLPSAHTRKMLETYDKKIVPKLHGKAEEIALKLRPGFEKYAKVAGFSQTIIEAELAAAAVAGAVLVGKSIKNKGFRDTFFTKGKGLYLQGIPKNLGLAVRDTIRPPQIKKEIAGVVISPGVAAVIKTAEMAGRSQAPSATESVDATLPSADKFAAAVIRKNIWAILPGRSEYSIAFDEVGKYFNHGPNAELSQQIDHGADHLQHRIGMRSHMFPEFVTSQLVSVTPSATDPDKVVLTIRFFQDPKVSWTKRYYERPLSACVQTELPSGVMKEFLQALEHTPDLLEDFYQKVFPGLDVPPGNPGMNRVKANGFYLIAGNTLDEANNKFNSKLHDPPDMRYYDQSIRDFFQSLKKYQYQQGPYGTGESYKSMP